MPNWIRGILVPVLGVMLGIFTLAEVNYPHLQDTSQKAIFVLLGLVLCFLTIPVHKRFESHRLLRGGDIVLALATIVCCGYVFVQNEPLFESFWLGGVALGDRAGNFTPVDFWIGLVGVVIVIEATRRSIGWAVPLLAIAAIAYAYFRSDMPSWLFPHKPVRGDELVSAMFLKGQGVFGKAAGVMFKYVFLFVIFGAFLEVTGATQFIIDFSERVFGGTPGGPAKVSVLGSGLMGSLSGSAVANAVTTGSFTIPMMRNAGFAPHIAGGITAAAASGGALVPPVMGAGAYMMLEFIDGLTFLEVAKAAVIPAVLYYFSIFMIVHFYARKMGSRPTTKYDQSLLNMLVQFESVVFFGALATLLVFLSMGYTPFRSVSYSLGVIGILWLIHPRKKFSFKALRDALVKSAYNGVSLVAASACVGIVIGVVDATGVVAPFGEMVKGLVAENLFLALVGVMCVSIVLGMGVPSVVCYLLMATMMGSLLKQLGVPELSAHLFIFYFGMMSMVTPPVALAAYASASLAKARIMQTAFAAFRFALVGFTLPYMFIYRPALLLMAPDGGSLALNLCIALITAVIGIVALAAGLTGFLRSTLSMSVRVILLAAAALLLYPELWPNGAGALLFVVVVTLSSRSATAEPGPPTPTPQTAS